MDDKTLTNAKDFKLEIWGIQWNIFKEHTTIGSRVLFSESEMCVLRQLRHFEDVLF